MRTNLPVTRNEVQLESGKPIVTKTDLRGVIVYANDSFVEISGYSRAELIGQNHNIVRHPDMPEQAFEDLWRTVKTGQPWRGLVKNRAKNGDFYWVEAFVSPIVENGAVVGYMSVRNRPDPREVREAAALYDSLRGGRAGFPPTRIVINDHPARLMWAFVLLALLASGTSAMLSGWPAHVLEAVSAALILITALYVQRMLIDPIQRVNDAIVQINEGRLAEPLSQRCHGLSPLILRLEGLRINLRATFCDVSIQTRRVDSRSSELDGVVQSLVVSSADQRDNMFEVASAMEQMSASVREISIYTAESTRAVRATEECAHTAIVDMERAVSASDAAADVAQQSHAQIVEMNQSVGRITELTNIIRDIADQTNLLALNAAIEAARAGEQGRGFAVVADEVRKLAEKTAMSTADISRVVDEIILKSHGAVDTMNSVSTHVRETVEGIQLSGQRLREIWQQSRKATEHTQSINEMLQQQSEMTNQVTGSITRISGTIDATSACAGEMGDASAQLHHTASALRGLIHHLERALT